MGRHSGLSLGRYHRDRLERKTRRWSRGEEWEGGGRRVEWEGRKGGRRNYVAAGKKRRKTQSECRRMKSVQFGRKIKRPPEGEYKQNIRNDKIKENKKMTIKVRMI